MRSTTRDETGILTFDGGFAGSGVVTFANPIPFWVTRIGAGQYVVRFDPSIIPAEVSGSQASGPILPYAFGPGTFSVNTTNTTGSLVDSPVWFQVKAHKTSP
jgi:hypothetical protein